jgi:hypothetical protein
VHQARRWFDGDVELGTTSALRTVLDCATTMPFPEALAVADSALAQSYLHKENLIAAAVERPGAGRRFRLRVAEAADRRADNPFESVLRAVLLTAAGWTVLRFAYRQVMGRPEWVVETVRATREKVFHTRSRRLSA